MRQEDRQKLFDKLMIQNDSALPPRMREEFAELVTKDLDDIEPLIDEMLQTACDSLAWNKITGAWDYAAKIRVHSAIQLLAFLKAHEWREPRPGYTNCAECHAEFLATPIENRSHRARCSVAGLIKELHEEIVKLEGSKDYAATKSAALS